MGKENKYSEVHYPVGVKDLIPQKGLMRFVDSILGTKEQKAYISFKVSADNPFVDDYDRLDEVTFMEMVAQAVAAHAGLDDKLDSKEPGKGFLLGCKDFVINRTAEVGDELIIVISKQAAFGDFSIIDGLVYKGEDLLASGEIKIWKEKQ